MDYLPEEIAFVEFCTKCIKCELSECPGLNICEQRSEGNEFCLSILDKMRKGEELGEQDIDVVEFFPIDELWKKGTCNPKGSQETCPNKNECNKRTENEAICTVLLRKLGRYLPEENRIMEVEINKIIRNDLLNIDFGLGEKPSLIDYEVYIPEINGRIDLLLKAEQSCLLIVIELKSETATREHVGQLASYVGWYRKNPDKMPAQTKRVKGILLARDFSPGAKYALEECPDLEPKIFELHVDIKNT